MTLESQPVDRIVQNVEYHIVGHGIMSLVHARNLLPILMPSSLPPVLLFKIDESDGSKNAAECPLEYARTHVYTFSR